MTRSTKKTGQANLDRFFGGQKRKKNAAFYITTSGKSKSRAISSSSAVDAVSSCTHARMPSLVTASAHMLSVSGRALSNNVSLCCPALTFGPVPSGWRNRVDLRRNGVALDVGRVDAGAEEEEDRAEGALDRGAGSLLSDGLNEERLDRA